MSRVTEATLADGTTLPYVETANPPRGGMKHTFFAPDRSYVVQFFNNPEVASDGTLRDRLDAILGRYNPTLAERSGGARGNTDQTASYFRDLFCWPTAIVTAPSFGIVCPTYPRNYFFGDGASSVLDLGGKEKKSNWFTSRNRRYLESRELGDFRTMLGTSLQLARAIRRLHAAGLAHSDLSNNNVLIDPVTGSCVVIDIDSLVVPNMFAPEVVGTRGYIAPEVLSTMEYDRNDRRRALPRIETDLHSLPVLIYQYLFWRHPLEGPKVYSTESAEQDDFLAFGPQATFIEDPNDTSNRPNDLDRTIDDLGPGLRRLFLRAFVDGLHHPGRRPSAAEWENELMRAYDMLKPCPNPDCPQGWFIQHDSAHPACPSCGTTVDKRDRIELLLKRPARMPGQWRSDRTLVLYPDLHLRRWHVYTGEPANEKADSAPQARIHQEEDGRWYLVNEGMTGLMSPTGNLVPQNAGIELKNGAMFRTTDEPNGRLVEVRCG